MLVRLTLSSSLARSLTGSKGFEAKVEARCPLSQGGAPARKSHGTLLLFSAVSLFCLRVHSVTHFPVAISEGSHPFPSRTRKLSPPEPMVLRGKPRGRVGRCRIFFSPPLAPFTGPRGFFFPLVAGFGSSVAPRLRWASSLARLGPGRWASAGGPGRASRAMPERLEGQAGSPSERPSRWIPWVIQPCAVV